MKPISLCPFLLRLKTAARFCWALCFLLPTARDGAAAEKTVPRYQRLELSFESAINYSNPVQEAAITAVFTPPDGDKVQIPGFWDGGCALMRPTKVCITSQGNSR